MLHGIPRSARCVQRFDDSLNSAIHITYRISLRSSSMREPRDPLLKVVTLWFFTFWTFVFKCERRKRPVKIATDVVHRCVRFDDVQPRRTAEEIGGRMAESLMILPQVHLRKPCYDFYFL
jgi:hypothetical protein